MDNKDYLATLLPHKKPMILIDDVVDYSLSEKWLKTCVTINEDSLFYDKDLKGISPLIGIEYMAQSVGCYAFLQKKLETPKIGYLLGSRLYNNSITVFELNETYSILAKEMFFGNDVSSFDCLIYNKDNEEVASASLNVYQKDNDDE